MSAIPTKLFDVRNSNNAVDSDATLYALKEWPPLDAEDDEC